MVFMGLGMLIGGNGLMGVARITMPTRSAGERFTTMHCGVAMTRKSAKVNIFPPRLAKKCFCFFRL
jgi:hypothetical protein